MGPAGQNEKRLFISLTLKVIYDMSLRLCFSLRQIVQQNGRETQTTSSYCPPLTCVFAFLFCRCGGQGDLLSGSLAPFLFWAHQRRPECPDPGNYTKREHRHIRMATFSIGNCDSKSKQFVISNQT